MTASRNLTGAKYVVVEDDTKVDLGLREKFYLLMERAAQREFDVLAGQAGTHAFGEAGPPPTRKGRRVRSLNKEPPSSAGVAI